MSIREGVKVEKSLIIITLFERGGVFILTSSKGKNCFSKVGQNDVRSLKKIGCELLHYYFSTLTPSQTYCIGQSDDPHHHQTPDKLRLLVFH